MHKFGIGQAVSRFEDPRLVRGGGRYVDDMVLPGMAFGHVLRSPHAHARIRAIDAGKARAAPGVLAVLTGADWEASGWGDLPVPGGLKRRDGGPMYRPRYPALVARAGALGRRLRRLRGGGDLPAGGGCGRADRSRLRTAAGRGLDRRSGGAGRAAGVGRLPGQHLLRASGRRQGCGRRRLRARGPCGARAFRHQSRDRGDHGAARQHRRLQPHRRPLHHLHHAAARAPVSRRACPRRAEGAGEPGPRRRRRHRRQLRDEVGGLQRGRAGAAGREDRRPSGEVGEHALGGVSQRRPGARQRHRRRARARGRRHVSRAAGQDDRRRRRLSAGGDAGRRRQSRNARRRLSHAGDPCRRHRRVQPHQSDPALSRQRPPRGGLRDRADGRPRRRPPRHRPRRAAPAQHHSRRRDAVQDRPELHL